MKARFFLLMTAIILCAVMILSGCKSGGDTAAGSDKPGKSDVHISPDGDSGKIKDGSSSFVYGDDQKWPEKLMAGLPEPKCKITAVMKDDNTQQCTVAFSELGREDAKSYINKLKELGYSDGMDLDDGESFLFSGTSGSGSEVTFTYDVNAKEGTIAYDPKKQ